MTITDAFKDKTLVITGGTGSFGSTVLKHFLTSDIGEIRIISRDEKKQDMMRHILQARYPEHAGKVQFYVGDVRRIESVRDVMYGADYVFHAAALKEVPSCEFFPMEAVRTNIIGTDNVITAAVENRAPAKKQTAVVQLIPKPIATNKTATKKIRIRYSAIRKALAP